MVYCLWFSGFWVLGLYWLLPAWTNSTLFRFCCKYAALIDQISISLNYFNVQYHPTIPLKLDFPTFICSLDSNNSTTNFLLLLPFLPFLPLLLLANLQPSNPNPNFLTLTLTSCLASNKTNNGSLILTKLHISIIF